MTGRSGTLTAVLATVAVMTAIAACGDGGDAGENAPPASPDAGPVDGPARPADDAASDADSGPVHAPFGLDQRPSNASCVAPPRQGPPVAVAFQRVFANVILPTPIAMAQVPGDSTRWFAASLDGTVRSFPVASPPDNPPKVLDLTAASGRTVAFSGEGGLLGFAFHPKFAQNGRIFVSWSDAPSGGAPMHSIVSRLTSPDNGASFGQHTIVVGPFDQPSEHHLGGGIAFGPGGLYVSFGDGVMAADPQLRTGYFSKLLRIDVDAVPGPLGYAVPADNPFASTPGAEATFAYGFRNPFRFSIDRGTGEVWVGDVGASEWEEINRVGPGGNYGWPCREGAHAGVVAGGCPGPRGFIDPVAEHDHGGATPIARSITGGFVYRGKAIPSLVGSYIYGDFSHGEIWSLRFDPATGAATSTLLNAAGPTGAWTAFSEDNDGEIYVLSFYDGAVYELVPTGPASPSTFPDRLSKTGCVDVADPRKPASGLLPYVVNVPSWNDGAETQRLLAVPDGKAIHVAVDGDFSFPIGTVLSETFTLAGKRVETRLLMRHDDGEWGGYSYEWLDDESDAILLPASKTKVVSGQSWFFPSRADCMRCHTAAAGRALGPELAQLNGDLLYATTNRISNQLSTMIHVGYFDAPLGAVSAVGAYPTPGGAAPLDARARAYLHANCSMCHRPAGPTQSEMDLRFSTLARDTKTCGFEPVVDDLGVAGAKVVAPGHPELSMLALRARATNASRMPPLGSAKVDAVGTKLLDDWIASISVCP